MTPYRVALIGTGRVGYQFSFGALPDNHAAAVADSPACTLVAGVNRGREKLEAFGRRFGVDALYQDYRQMLDEVNPDICVIATHPELHREMVEACAAVPSTRAIVCEKPMALSLADCDAMIDACDRAGVLLQINHNRRWHPEWQLGVRLVREGAIGDLVHVECHMDGGKPSPAWRSEREGPMLHDFTHFFDVMDMVAGPVEWLCGMAEQRRRPWPVEDFAAAFFRFRSGVTGTMRSAELTGYTDYAFEARGTDGVIRYVAGETLELLTAHEDSVEPDSGFRWRSLQPQPIDHPTPASFYVLGLRELLGALDGHGTIRSDGRVARRSIEMVTAVYQSQLAGNRPIHFPLTDTTSGVEALRRAGAFESRPL